MAGVKLGPRANISMSHGIIRDQIVSVFCTNIISHQMPQISLIAESFRKS